MTNNLCISEASFWGAVEKLYYLLHSVICCSQSYKHMLQQHIKADLKFASHKRPVPLAVCFSPTMSSWEGADTEEVEC